MMRSKSRNEEVRVVSPPPATERILEAIGRIRKEGREPLALFDLDSTLYDDRLRTLRILHEFGYEHALARPKFLKAVCAAGVADMPYRVIDAVRALGFDDPALLDEVLTFWRARFFTSEYVHYDLPTPGAATIMARLLDAGAMAVCLTGRAAAPMLAGTIATLQRDGLPVGSADCRLILKPATRDSDEFYKAQVVERLKISGEVVAAFDNEPGICNLLRRACPDASVFHVATTWTVDAPELDPGIQVIADFRALLDN